MESPGFVHPAELAGHLGVCGHSQNGLGTQVHIVCKFAGEVVGTELILGILPILKGIQGPFGERNPVFLREAGYWEIDMIPSKNFFYVGISNYSPKPNGEVVWLERYEKYPEKVIVSRYDQKMFIPIVVRTGDFTWVKIDRRGYSPVRELNQKMVGVHATSL